jgi:hypothetical protein
LSLCGVLSCGQDPGPSDEGTGPTGWAEHSATRRLTVEEWRNTVADLLGVDVDTSLLPVDEIAAGFPANVSAAMSELEIEQTLEAAESVAAEATADPVAFLGCDPVDPVCIESWAGPFLERAWRRPVTTEEIASFVALADLGDTPADGVRLAVTGALVSGSFLFRPETGGEVEGGRVQLDDWQMASRLSYLLWRTMPDDVLFDAARAGELSTAEQIEAQAVRMLADPRGARTIASFQIDWLGLGKLALQDRAASVTPPEPLEDVPMDLPAAGWIQTDAVGTDLPPGTFTDILLNDGSPGLQVGPSDDDTYAHHGVLLGRTFELHGKMRIDDPDATIGVTFYSGMPDTAAFYRLQQRPNEKFSLVSFGTLDTCTGSGAYKMLPDEWTQFSIYVHVSDIETRVSVEVHLWPEGDSEPNEPTLGCDDVSFTHLESGTFGLWAAGPGVKTWGALELATEPPRPPFDFDAAATAFVDGGRSFLETWASDGANLKELLDADWAMANEALAPYLGVTGITGEAYQRVTLPPERVGFLTHPLVLSSYAKPDQSSPIVRGKAVREHLLCDVISPPPPDVVVVAPDLDPTLTTRERFSAHATDPTCAACHSLMDPIGFGFEAFDQLGAYRTEEFGLPIDASGEIVGGGDAGGTFADVLGLVDRLAGSEPVRSCVLTHWYRYHVAHLEKDSHPDPALAAAQAACVDDTCRVEDIVRALVTADSFRYRAAHEGDTP